MNVSIVGGGPAGLYAALLLKKARPDARVVVYERNPQGATYGWGVVFSDRTLASFREADLDTYERITEAFIVWDAIDVRYRDRVVRCGGQGFSGIARRALLGILHDRAEQLGVRFEYENEIVDPADLSSDDLVIGADGVRSVVRERHREVFRPRFTAGTSRYIWFGTDRLFDSFTFAFRDNDDGAFQAHAYPFDGQMSTFIVECDDRTWANAGLNPSDESTSIEYCETLFERDLRGHRLLSNNSKWIRFETLKNRTWRHGNTVLVGDAAHTAHFSIGSGTKLAMEDSISLVDAIRSKASIEEALIEYELDRKPRVERFQEAARQSQDYFENTHLYRHMEPEQFAFHLLSRSGRIDYADLRVRDGSFVSTVDRWFASLDAEAPSLVAAPAAFAAFRLREVAFRNRIVIALPAGNDALDGMPSDSPYAHTQTTGAGILLVGPVAISAHARVAPGDAGIYRPEHVGAWKEHVARAHDGGSVPGITLGHSGPRGAARSRDRYCDVALSDEAGWTPVAASSQRYTPWSSPAAEIDERTLGEVEEEFVGAAARAEEAGFQLLELHMGHGYLLGSFLSPLTNRREDDLGGGIENRMRYPLRIFRSVRASWPADLPLGVAINGADWSRGGAKLQHAVALASALDGLGCDFVRILAGQTVASYSPRLDPYFLTHYAERIRNQVGIATIATGLIDSIDRVNTLIASGRADLCQMSLQESQP